MAEIMEQRRPIDAWQRCAENSPQGDAISKNDAAELCTWIIANGLSSACSAVPEKSFISASSLWFVKIPLVNPDAALVAISRRVGWVFSWQSMLAAVCCFLLVCGLMIGQWQSFIDSYRNLFTSWNLLLMPLAWAIMKLIHEVAHGVSCVRNGGGSP